ncbi:MAG: TolC family protein, partial [candidate division WOR-3 bacterium]
FYPAVGIQGSFAYLSEVSVLSFPGTNIALPLGSHANYSTKLTLSQTLFAGGRLRKGYEAAKLGVSLAQDSVRRRQQHLALSVRRSFNTILLTRELARLTRQGLERALDHMRVVCTLHDAGYVSRYDSLRTAVQVENLKPQLARIESGVRLALDALKLLIGMPMEQELDVTGKLEAGLESIDSAEAVNQALANRVELRQLDHAVRALRLAREITQAAYYPALGVSASYELKKPAGLTGGGFGPNLTLALGLSYTLFDGLRTRAQLRQTDADIRRLEVLREMLREGIVLQVREALMSLEIATTALEAAKGNVAAATEGLRLAETRYAQGHGSNLDALDAQLALYQAEVNLLSAAKDWVDARDRLVNAIGKEE